MSGNENKVELGLKSHHVFLDTEVFKRRGHNLTVQPFPALGDYLVDKNLTLHTTEVTLRELKRQIRSDALDLTSQLTAASKRVASWKHKAPNAPLPEVKAPDAEAVAKAAWSAFRHKLKFSWHAIEHQALNVPASEIFDRYFERLPPFQEGKEFPDAFVISALERWCKKNDEKMYVVTQDKAFLAAAEASEYLMPLSSLEEFLQKVTEAETPQAITVVESILLSAPNQKVVEQAIQDQFDSLVILYSGDLHEGELTDAKFGGDATITEFWIIAQNNNIANVLVKARVNVLADISFEDISSAIYDKEDGVYFGSEPATAEIEDEVTARVSVTIDMVSQAIKNCEVLSDELFVQESDDSYS